MDADDFEAILASVRTFVHDEVRPREEQIEETDEIPPDLRKKAAAMGLFGFALPEEFGGLGFSMTEDVRLAFELARTTPAFRSMVGTNNGLAGKVLVHDGSPEQQQTWLPRIAAGEVIASFALTEADAGSDPSGLRTRARREGDGWVLDGAKRFITNAPVADLFVVFARTDSDTAGTSRGISAFLVEAGTPGLFVGPKDKKMGQAGAWTAEVVLDEVRVPADALVGAEGAGFRTAMKSLARGRLHVAALCVGLADRILEETVQAAATIRQGGQAIGEFQLVQAHLAESQAELYAGRAMVLEAARAYDAGEDMTLAPSSAKLFCSEMLGRVADRGVQVHGGMGYMRSVPVERFYRDARLFRIYEGTSEIQKLIIARRLLADVAG
ncbi:acyl-CoA dehydrogenase family protein [Pseudonocardia halophobica]|uniref:Acyl-CoA dehydrogenase n=1 Tax=Pseudonocardia halophobica TaxID=29401 RepID=A0A9W6L7W4_9PSEU|nr:acyl-CoA dehydrogenase family protein [Pseudonocardia halophobica]GLL13849.1 acyl-CoA dehydrogenase [Pseudonocardia halophobica]